MFKFAPPNHPILTRVASEVPLDQIQTPEIQNLIDEMLLIAKGERQDTEKRVMIGLAAPQIGIDMRIIIVDMSVTADRRNLGQLKAFINPSILSYSAETDRGREGCFSTGRVCGIVERPLAITLSAFDRDGTPILEEISGFTARIFQHEIDHLNGIRFPDRVTCADDLHWVGEDDHPEYRNKWENWDQKFPHEEWVKMKNNDEN